MKEPRILFIAPLRDISGYAEVARHYVNALDSIGCDIVTRHLIYDGAKHPPTDRELELESKPLKDIDIVVQHTTPNETEKKDGVFNVNIFCWETDRIPPEWTNQLNTMDLVIVPCRDNIDACVKSHVAVPIEKVHFAFDINRYKTKPEPFFIDNSRNMFKLLTICQISKKKGIDVLLKAYFSEFKPEDNTLLILKVYSSVNDGPEERQKMVNQINKIKELTRLDSFPKVMLVHEVINQLAITKLYSAADAYVLPSRGEGWSVTHFDAMGYGLPPIATNWGGPVEFIDDSVGWLVDYHMSPCFDMPHPHAFMYTSRDNWPEPHIDSLRSAMRQAFHEWKIYKVDPYSSRWRDRIDSCKKRVEQYSYDKVGPVLKDAIMKHYSTWKEYTCQI